MWLLLQCMQYIRSSAITASTPSFFFTWLVFWSLSWSDRQWYNIQIYKLFLHFLQNNRVINLKWYTESVFQALYQRTVWHIICIHAFRLVNQKLNNSTCISDGYSHYGYTIQHINYYLMVSVNIQVYWTWGKWYTSQQVAWANIMHIRSLDLEIHLIIS